MNLCLTNHDLERYHADDLPAEEAARVALHLGGCGDCRQRDAEFVADHEDIVLQLRAFERTATVGGSRLATTAPALPVIQNYEIIKELQGGGQGVVYQAIQKTTKKRVAVKVMREGPFASSRDRARFDREVQILAQLRHPNIVTIHDSGSVGGIFYYVMDYVPGQPLDQYLAARSGFSPPLPREGASGGATRSTRGSGPRARLAETLRLFVKICSAVNAAHLRGVTHRDLKPSNIMVGTDAEPYILDFGLAKIGTQEPSDDLGAGPLSITGQFIGSLPWASPEQAEGAPAKIDLRTDVYSLGVILYQMLTGRFPYEVVGNIRDVLNNILNAAPARPSTMRRQINDEVETIVLKCLNKERDRRYQSAGELGRDLERYLVGQPIEAKKDSAWYVMRKLVFRNAQTAAIVILVFAILLSCVAVSGFYYAEMRQAAEERDAKAGMAAAGAAELSDLATNTLPEIRQLALGWFLDEWHAGRLKRARDIREQFGKTSPEYAAAGFLLDESYPLERLVAQMPAGSESLAVFASGERNLKAGRLNAALEAFESIKQNKTDGWLYAAVQARLEQLRAIEAPVAATGAP